MPTVRIVATLLLGVAVYGCNEASKQVEPKPPEDVVVAPSIVGEWIGVAETPDDEFVMLFDKDGRVLMYPSDASLKTKREVPLAGDRSKEGTYLFDPEKKELTITLDPTKPSIQGRLFGEDKIHLTFSSGRLRSITLDRMKKG